jgi:hypothetical protein
VAAQPRQYRHTVEHDAHARQAGGRAGGDPTDTASLFTADVYVIAGGGTTSTTGAGARPPGRQARCPASQAAIELLEAVEAASPLKAR